MLKTPPQTYNPHAVEEKILSFWRKEKIFEKSVENRKNNPRYVFLEGPPTANGVPHPGHVLTRVMKDLILRYKTMKGYYIPRKAGWDTHGLPVEIEVEKTLGLKNKQDVERYGIKKFNEKCKESVFKYENAWVEMTERIGFWLDMENPYITLKNDYIESVWWSLKQAWEKKLLYKGYKVVPYCPRCGTALSAHEVAQGYRTIEEPSIFVKFKLKDEDAYFLAWTTTPWTLLSNVALAVHPDELYIKIRYNNQVLILAEERANILLKGQDYEILDGFKGKELEYKEYEPLFTYAKPEEKAWYVILADFVTMDEGTGIVHIAPAFGEDDYNVGRKYNLPVIQLVKLDGTFKEEVELWKGRFVKDADPDIIKYLEDKGLLEGVRNYSHEYPFCWRCNSPLLYYAMDSWFIAMSKVQDDLIKNNRQINWYPSHLQEGRFGDFIRDVKDWALSRKRYWGTPLPIWTCENKDCRHQICIGSVEELKSLSENFTEDYDLHKPYVDELIVRCPKCGSRMKRESEVIDCWYDSGSAFFAQWHYPFENQDTFKESFPVDFICEALDQTRGWFYSLLAISTFLFGKPSYKNVLTLGLVLDKDNQKMSKSKRNYVDPMVILDNEGADALRWYLISANAPWNSTRFYEEAVKDTLAKFILTLWNSYNFFATYAALDKFDPRNSIPIDKRIPLDRWILSRFHRIVRDIKDFMEKFETHKAARVIEKFLIDDFSNWYLRRSRRRLWVEEETTDKLSGYSTMYEVFLGLTKTIAPFTPFIAEEIYQNLKTDEIPESVHLCDYITPDEKLIDDELEKGMERIRDLVEVGRALRAKIGIKVRYPLREATLVCTKEVENSIKDLLDLLIEEINVKNIRFDRNKDKFVIKQVKPKYSILGPKLKDKMKQVSKILEEMDKTSLYNKLMKEKEISIEINGETINLAIDDFDIVEQEKENIAITETKDVILLLDTMLTPELEAEGFAREVIRRIQSMRKELNLNVDDKIKVEVEIADDRREDMIKQWKDYIAEETRAEKFNIVSTPKGSLVKKWDIDDVIVSVGIT
ncbi:MAG: isoleucine--tRNA ligase [Thermoplasmata archaeon]|nr:MAG: isoleucine--tRNA ligase [Thermoplasmata archaeon]